MELLSPSKDSLFLLEETMEPEEAEADHLPVNVTTMNVLADATGDLATGRCARYRE